MSLNPKLTPPHLYTNRQKYKTSTCLLEYPAHVHLGLITNKGPATAYAIQYAVLLMQFHLYKYVHV